MENSIPFLYLMTKPLLIIPDDWDEVTDGYCQIAFTVPDSVKWRAMIIGQVTDLMHPVIYDPTTGNPQDTADEAIKILNNVTRKGCTN